MKGTFDQQKNPFREDHFFRFFTSGNYFVRLPAHSFWPSSIKSAWLAGT